MTAAGTMGVEEFLTGGVSITVSTLDQHLGLSPERRNQLVQKLENVCGTAIPRRGNARQYTSNVADVLMEAKLAGGTFETALRAALLHRGVELPMGEELLTPAEMHEALHALHGRLTTIEETELDGSLAALREQVRELQGQLQDLAAAYHMQQHTLDTQQTLIEAMINNSPTNRLRTLWHRVWQWMQRLRPGRHRA